MTAFLPRHLSVSAVQTYVRCPAQWRARYVDRLVMPSNPPMMFGKAFHAALEAEHRGENSERALIAAWNAGDVDLAASGQVLRPDKVHALALLDAYKARGLGGAMGEPERKFLMPFPSGRIPVPVLGYIDAVLPDEIREYKTTASQSWTEVRAKTEQQAAVYGWAHTQIYRRRVPIRYVIFRTDIVSVEEFLVPYSPEIFRVFEQQAELVWAGISAGAYDGCGKQNCDVCRVETKQASAGPTVEWDG